TVRLPGGPYRYRFRFDRGAVRKVRRPFRRGSHREIPGQDTVILTDTGPLVAVINRNDPNHARCVEATKQLPVGPMVTTWPCFTEAMYLLHRAGGYPAQASLWELRTSKRLVLRDLNDDELDRMIAMMEKYRD